MKTIAILLVSMLVFGCRAAVSGSAGIDHDIQKNSTHATAKVEFKL